MIAFADTSVLSRTFATRAGVTVNGSQEMAAIGTANIATSARVAITWAAATADGDFGLTSALAFTGGAANGPVAAVSLWSAISAGTFYGDYPITGDATFNSAGEYTLTALNINGSAS